MADIKQTAETSKFVSHGLRLLWVGAEEPSWIGMALRLDAEGLHEPRFRWAETPTKALGALRDEVFDCILVGESTPARTACVVDSPLMVVQAIRRSGYHDPIIFVASRCDDSCAAQLCELDCDVLVTPNSYDSPALLSFIRRAVSRAERNRESQRLTVAQQRRLIRDRSEAEQLLQQQRSIIAQLESSSVDQNEELDANGMAQHCREQTRVNRRDRSMNLPVEMQEFYHELLRTFVMMGSGSLGSDIEGFAHLMATAGVSLRQALQFHLERVESLVRDLGSRSTRHVMARADLLALELMVYLGEEYRQLRHIGPSNHHLNGCETPNVE